MVWHDMRGCQFISESTLYDPRFVQSGDQALERLAYFQC